MLELLYIGDITSYANSNTCLHRLWALKRLANVDSIDMRIKRRMLSYRIANRLFNQYHLPIHYINKEANKEILDHIHKKKYNIIWIDKGIYMSIKTFTSIKKEQKDCKIVGYSPDNMIERHNQSQVFLDSIPYYDFFITTKLNTVKQLQQMGFKKVLFVNNAYEDSFHHPYSLTKAEQNRFGCDIGFIGTWEKERCESILYLAKNGLNIKIFGGGKWLNYKNIYPNMEVEGYGLYGEDYNKAMCAFKISLCFLRKMNSDTQTTRTMEIPACGCFMMAERTEEHLALFKDREEACFFSSNEELLELCRYYIEKPKEREKIALAGRKRCLSSGYSNYETLKNVVITILNA